ncbi:MAG: adenosine kinase [Alphaproteobacteria bacterium]|jgi:sugar/nucleoside kinase (ribokinase family)
MADATLDVVGIGNAIVDVLAHADDAFIDQQGLTKGAMALIDADQAQALYGHMGSSMEVSGGSAANTIVGVAALGGRGAYIGKVRDDQLGAVFAHDIRASGVSFETPLSTDGAATARCLILVTPDAQRTMNTFLGACVELGPDDVDPALIESAQVTYMEGYLWDPAGAKEAFRKAHRIAHGAGRRVALSLSDPFCVDRYRDEFAELVADHIDILFANEDEIMSLYQVDSFEAALDKVRGHCEVAALTRSEKGSVVVSGEQVHHVAAAPVNQVVDTTGAGDLYAAGFLHGFTQGWSLDDCARLAGIAAAEVISHMGARPEADLAKLKAEAFG